MAGIVEDQDKKEVFVPPAVLHEALAALNKVVPAKSKHSYEKEYANFCEWRKRKQARGVELKIILTYISERSKNAKFYHHCGPIIPNLRKCYLFHQLSAFLKQQSVGHGPKKSKVFTLEEMERFLDTAPDDKYLLLKMVLIVGVFGGCKIGELMSMLVDDIDDRNSVIVVEIPDTKTHKPRTFTIINGSNTVHAID
ncbi:Phage integrase domain containing protein, partial [Asbolus verrucosus]